MLRREQGWFGLDQLGGFGWVEDPSPVVPELITLKKDLCDVMSIP